MASPLPACTRHPTLQRDLDDLTALVRAQEISRIVVGLPVHMSGEEGEMAQEARAFASALGKRTRLPVELFDERLTSAEAERAMLEGNLSRSRRRQLRDSLSAVLILQGFLARESAEAEASLLSEERNV